MHLLVVHDVEVPLVEATDLIARVLQRSPYDARQTANVAAPGPVVAATYPDSETALAHAASLSDGGVPSFVVAQSEIIGPSQRFVARRVELSATELVVYSRSGETKSVRYEAVDLLLRGIGVTNYDTSEVESSRKLSMGRALATGGMSISKKVENARKTTRSKRSGFLYIHAGAHLIALHEDELQYDGLGSEMKPTRTLNFGYLCKTLAARCGGAVSDDRLNNRVRQVQLLGPKLSPEQFLDVATSVLAMTLRRGW